MDHQQAQRIINALERIADCMEEQMELTRVMQLDAAVILKAGANEVNQYRDEQT